MSFWQPVEDPGTRPPRSRVLDIGCAIFAGAASLAHFALGQTAHPAPRAPSPVALGIALYTVAATMRRVTAPAAAALVAAAGVPSGPARVAGMTAG